MPETIDPIEDAGPFRAFRMRPKHVPAATAQIVARFGAVEGEEATIDLEDENTRRRLRRLVWLYEPGDPLYRRDSRGILAMSLEVERESEEWRQRAVRLLLALPDPLSVKRVYELYQTYYETEEVRAALAGAFERGERIPELDEMRRSHLISPTPVVAVTGHALYSRLSLRKIAEVFALNRARPLNREVARRILTLAAEQPVTDPYRAWLLGQTPGDAEAAARSFAGNDAERVLLLTTFVRAYDCTRWKLTRVDDHPVLSHLLKTITDPTMLGNPAKQSHQRRWVSAPNDVRQLVRKWLLQQEIVAFFARVDATPDRKTFWRRAAGVIEEIEPFPDCSAFAMKIGSLWFMEFGQIGNACYTYEDQNFRSVRWQYERGSQAARENPGALKKTEYLFQPPISVLEIAGRTYDVGTGRLPHLPRRSAGEEGWHRKFEAFIHVFCHADLE